MNIESKKCKNCEGTVSGRSNKVFCEPSCKSDYHNKRYIAKLRLEMKEQIKKNLNEHLINIAQTTNLEMGRLRKRIYSNLEGTENDDAMFSYSQYTGILKEIKKIKSILQ